MNRPPDLISLFDILDRKVRFSVEFPSTMKDLLEVQQIPTISVPRPRSRQSDIEMLRPFYHSASKACSAIITMDLLVRTYISDRPSNIPRNVAEVTSTLPLNWALEGSHYPLAKERSIERQKYLASTLRVCVGKASMRLEVKPTFCGGSGPFIL